MAEEKVNILLVDDREEGLLTLEVILRRDNYNLIKARSGRDALSQILKNEFAVILMDVQMPEMDGFETASLIKTHEHHKYIPIIFVTGLQNDPRFVSQGYSAGAIDYVTKPFEPYILRSKVGVLVDLYLKTKLIREMQQREHEQRLAQTRRTLEAEYLKKERRLISLVENSSDFIAIADTSYHVFYVNGAGRQLVGLENDAETAQYLVWDFLCSSEREKARNTVLKMLKDQQPWEAEMNFRHFGDGREIPVWCKTFPIFDPNTGEVDGFAAICRDISEKKRTEMHLKHTAEQLAKSNGELEQFAWFASHDLKEPIRMVSAYVKLLERKYKESLDPDTSEYIKFASEGSQRMYALVNDLLVFSGIEKSGSPYEWVECKDIMENVLHTLQITMDEHSAVVKFGELPKLRVDRVQLAQVFQNLIANAIKFRRDDNPVIEIESEERPGGWQFCVKDNGIGIDPQFADRIFGVFQRLHTREKYPGTGIGLAICRKIVERHGGRIWVESKPGEGSIFFFTLPKEIPYLVKGSRVLHAN